jgi:hypothetical protein
MTGALLQLVARGHIDSRLTGNPQISFFKTVYRRHTNFSIETLEQSFTGSVSNVGGTITADIITNGDLVTEMWLDVKIPSGIVACNTANLTYTYNTGHALIEEVKLKIGGNLIDKHTGGFMNVHTELTDHTDREKNILNRNRFFDDTFGAATSTKDLQLYVPLKFWFNRHRGLALPLVAIYNEPVSVELKTRHVLGLFNINENTLASTLTHAPATKIEVKLFANTIYLDKDERRRFAETQQHEYLIEQVQEDVLSFQKRVLLNFNYPVKELIWTIQYSSTRQGLNQDGGQNVVWDDLEQTLNGNEAAKTVVQNNNYFNYVCVDDTNTDNVGSSINRNHAFSKATLKINSKQRFEAQKPTYFSYLQRLYAGHRTIGDRTEGNDGIRGNVLTNQGSFDHSNVYVYSFALEPEKHQPSGTCNFSKLENCSLEFSDAITTQPKTITVYAINYNILVINGGYAKLAYN